ncbi:gas vesicle protein GvpL/GvpF [Krasilnikovia cinnamomea]|uniref:Gas vesicle protein GvpL/GvpF n=1 Tax=Krasilnikovia cinnamomea TaxID=349313 RepID=A0A4Q7ZT17_9ACTN|nr:GvpL/GvpF family gas vesicle protein [Krasilnikovia cinnamomea]RZU54001.1 gas vesicle protein GvpL/GvpF [Krasilnikovia cinnamomea]
MSTATIGAPRDVRPAAAGCYLYGVVPSGTRLPDDLCGVGPAGPRPTLIHHGDLAAVISPVARDRALGSRRDLLRHARILDELAASVPVLPARFGVVLDDPGSVVTRLLEPRRAPFAAALARLAGTAQFIVSVRHVEDAVLGEVLAGEPDIARLRELVRAGGGAAGVRVRLGELVAGALAARRARDRQHVRAVLEPYRVAAVTRPVTGADEAACVAFLVEHDGRARFEAAVQRLAAEWAGRARVRLLGPLAPYDFADALVHGEG